MSQRTRSVRLSTGLVAALALAAGLLAAPADAATQVKVKGVVTLNDKPLAGAKVTLLAIDAESGDGASPGKSVTTNSSGAYSIPIPNRKDVIYPAVLVRDPKHRAVSTVRSFAKRPTKTVNRKVTTKPAGVLAGKVTRADGASPTSTTVRIEGPFTDFSIPGITAELTFDVIYDDEQTVGADGSYRFVGLPAATYTICYDDTTSTYLDECYDQNVSDGPSSKPTKVTVKGGATTTLDDQVLDHLPAHVLGRVTDTNGKPISEVSVHGFEVGKSESYTRTEVSKSGQYDFRSAAGDNVQLKVGSDPYEPRWYNSSTRAGAQVFSLVEGTSVENETVALRSAARADMTVKPGTGKATLSVEVFRRATGYHPGGTVTVWHDGTGVSRTLNLKAGRATMTLKGIPSGRQKFYMDYSGTPSTADYRRAITAPIG